MRRSAELAAVALLPILASACGTPTASSASSTSPSAAPVSTDTALASLQSRPLRLPGLDASGGCPVSQVQHYGVAPPHKMPGYGFGPGPVFLTGQIDWNSGEAALLMVLPDTAGPIIVRGHQIDGSNAMPLQPQGPGGDVEFTDTLQAGQWRTWFGQLQAQPGCYGLQADGPDFSEVIVFEVQAGTPPPG